MDIAKKLRAWAEIDPSASQDLNEAANEIERLREEHETVSRIVDGMTLQFVERGKEIERLREALKFYANWSVVSAYIDDEIEEDRGDKARAALKEGE